MKQRQPKLKLKITMQFVGNEPENKDAFFMVLYNKPLHMCMEIFNDSWGNTWYKVNMLFGGLWYKRTIGPSAQNPSYMLFRDASHVVTYSHLMIKSKFPNAS